MEQPAEIAQACAGVPEIEFKSALFAFAGDRGRYWQLIEALFLEALALRDRHGWPPVVKDLHNIERPYLKHLAKLTLDEDAMPQLFATAPQLYWIYLHIDEKVWEKAVAERFGAIKLVWLQWLGSAAVKFRRGCAKTESPRASLPRSVRGHQAVPCRAPTGRAHRSAETDGRATTRAGAA